MNEADQILLPRWTIPVAGESSQHSMVVHENYAIVLLGSQIVDLGMRSEIREKWTTRESIELDQHVLIPGLINAHTHAAMTLYRGYADDLPLMQWLTEYIWPAEAEWTKPDSISAGTDLALLEMIRTGTTCFQDMYFYPNVVAARAESAGMRANVGMIVIEFPTAWANSADEYLQKGLDLRDAVRHSDLVTVAFAPHAPYTVQDNTLERIAALSEELDCQIHMHVHETEHEINESLARFGIRPLERLGRLGLVSPRLEAVHMTQLLDLEIEHIATQGVHVIHCPQSNLKLASGMCRVDALLQAGVNVAIGTDGAASNNDLDMLSETQTASLLAKGVSGNPSAMSMSQSLWAATMGGAKALGVDSQVGSIEVGKQADLVAIDLSHSHTQPLYHPLSQVIYACHSHQVSDVWIDGCQVLKERQPTRLDPEKILSDARQWGLMIAAKHPLPES